MPVTAKDKLRYEINADSSRYVSAMSSADRSTARFDANVSRLSRSLGAAGLAGATGLAVTAITGLTAATIDGVRSAAEWERRLLRTESLIRATGNAAGLSSQELSMFAKQLDLATLGDRDEIMDAINAMQTFKSVQGDIFKDAIRLSADLGEVLGVNLSNQAVQLGKVLEDPVAGLSSLRRVGISFTESQRDMIKALHETGQTADAQRVILKALEDQVGGAAAGAASGLSGKIDTLSFRWGEFKESLASDTNIYDVVAAGIDKVSGALERMTGFLSDPNIKTNLVPLPGIGAFPVFTPRQQGGQAVTGKIGPGTPGYDAYAAETAGAVPDTKAMQEAIGQSVFFGGDASAHVEAWQQRKELEGEILAEITEQYGDYNNTLLAIDYDGFNGRMSIYRQEEKERADMLKRRQEMQRAAAKQAVYDAKWAANKIGQDNAKAFKVYQAIAIGEATVAGYEAAVKAWSAGMSVGGPYAPAIAAAYTAASLARTGALISQISSASPGGGAGGGVAGGGGAIGTYPASPDTGIPTFDPALAEGEQRPSLHIDIRGDVIGDEQFVNNLVEKINDAADRDVYVNYSKEALS